MEKTLPKKNKPKTTIIKNVTSGSFPSSTAFGPQVGLGVHSQAFELHFFQNKI